MRFINNIYILYIYTHTHTNVDTVYISVGKQNMLSLATVSTQLTVTLRRVELTSKYVDSYHIAVNITHGTVIAFRIGIFHVIEKNTEGLFSLSIVKLRTNIMPLNVKDTM